MKKRIIVLLAAVLIVFLNIMPLQAKEEKRVLFISSYSYAWESVPCQIDGILSSLDVSVSLDIEYMDMKRFNDETTKQYFYEQLKYKLEHCAPYDVIITGDDPALNFVMEHRQDMFKDIPVVFEGVNNIETAKKASQDELTTGVVEELSYKDNIRFSRQIFPHAKRIVAICDDTVTGQGEREQFFANAKDYPDIDFEEINVSKLSEKELIAQLSSLDEETILFYLILSENKDHKTYTSKEAALLISENASVPCFRFVQPGIAQGLLGGKIVSHEKMGAIAGKMAQQIIDGKNTQDIPLELKSPNLYYLNEDVFLKFDLDLDMIPQGATVINHHLSFYEEHKKIIIVFGVALSFMFCILVIMIVHNFKKKKLIHELEDMTIQLNHIVQYDELTQLGNRRNFLENLETLIHENKQLTIAVFGLDNFKKVNDIFGNSSGNKILKKLAKRYQKMENEKTHFYRLSGDEFGIIFQSHETEEFIKSFMEMMNKPHMIHHQKCLLTCSVGLALYPNDSQDIEELLSYANSAMNVVKKAGKNNYRYYDQSIEHEQLELLKIENILEDALQNNGFRLVYQPLVDSHTGKVVSYEALLRLKYHTIRPDQFISVAEESGFIIPMSRWVIEQTVHDLARIKKSGKELKPISINFSSIQMRDVGLVNYVKNVLEKYDIEGKYIEFEITEGVFLKMDQEAERFFLQLIDMGIRLVLDDFGTGFASIQYLLDIPFYKIKLDKSMIYKFLNLHNGETLKQLISFIHSLNLIVVGEGVEVKEQFIPLQEFQCDIIQGYLFERPQDYELIEKSYDKKYDINFDE